MAAPVLATKLYTPSLRSNLVPRSRLIERLNEGSQRMPGVTLISAPAGFGKTTLASEWVANCGRVAAWLSLDEGDNDPDRFLRADLLVCCMVTNNETGVIQDIAAITKIARRHDVLVLTDCVQALGKIPVDVHEWDVDYASFSAHKLYGPKGVGALYVKEGSPFTPFLHGDHQESGLRAGTESIHNIAGFGAACDGRLEKTAQ